MTAKDPDVLQATAAEPELLPCEPEPTWTSMEGFGVVEMSRHRRVHLRLLASRFEIATLRLVDATIAGMPDRQRRELMIDLVCAQSDFLRAAGFDPV
jgi:hypothetical protein